MEESAEKSPEEAKVRTEGEGAEEPKEVEGEEEGGGEGQTSIFQSPLRLVRKTKMKLVVCHVTLLDGTDFTCEVEVRLGQKNPETDAQTVSSTVMLFRCDPLNGLGCSSFVQFKKYVPQRSVQCSSVLSRCCELL